MTETLTKSSPVITRRIVTLLDEQKEVLELKRVYYGDQDLIPEYPVACVESFPKDRALDVPGSTHKFSIVLRCGIWIYHGALQSSEVTKEEADIFTDRVEDMLHTDFRMNGLVIFGYVSRVDPGVVLRTGAMVQATRLTWEGVSREIF